jgi:Zn-dependent protease with chaperone function
VYLPYLLVANVQHVVIQELLLLLGGIIIAGAMLWSVLPRRHKLDALGPMLQRESHPRLFAELDDIAASLDEQLPREVYLMDQVNALVADRGGIFRSKRIMGIGLPLLSILTVSEFRAIVAHEFAHYYSGDTKFGPFVYKAQTAMIRTLKNVGSIEEIIQIQIIRVLYLLVALVLQHYLELFLRVTNFVSRKKEYRADELACLVAGVAPFTSALQKIHEADFPWSLYWLTEIQPLLEKSFVPGIAEGFTQYLATVQFIVEENESEQPKSKPFDTHPPLRHRIAAIEGLRVPLVHENSSPAISLLDSPDSAELQLVLFSNPKLDSNLLRRVKWDDIGPVATVPSWKSMISTYGSLLQGITVSGVPDIVANLRKIMPDPPRMLLDPQQRTQRASELLCSAVALALLERGWQLEAKPGVLRFRRGDESADPFTMIYELMDGSMSAQVWIASCTKLGISDSLLAPAATLSPAD